MCAKYWPQRKLVAGHSEVSKLHTFLTRYPQVEIIFAALIYLFCNSCEMNFAEMPDKVQGTIITDIIELPAFG
ncbi:MAG: hypothetical protein CVT94_12805 [Bacteroidetes bacterium HGW-Bacteroidetes-11]|nr:MAG: hypothetical protein CVT94_12805 [Bacteroidetes bacterium HGW-Bacteroidetes-11]